jgi:hypothetical protein
MVATPSSKTYGLELGLNSAETLEWGLTRVGESVFP